MYGFYISIGCYPNCIKLKTMKKKFILLPLVGLLIYAILAGNAAGPGTSSSHEGTGATATAGCSCHSSSATSTLTTTIQLLSGGTPVTTYTPGASYTVRITATNSTGSFLPGFGYQVSVVKDVSGTISNAGTLIAPVGSHTVSPGSSGITVVEHTGSQSPSTGTGSSGSTYSRDIPWTAPAAGTGCATIYGVINAVNNSGTSSGDNWNNTSLTIYEAVAAIAGASNVCVGATTTLSDPTPCGVWTSSNPATATVGSLTGVVTGVAAGPVNINYTAGTGNTTVKLMTVNAPPPNPTGVTAVCVGATTILSDATSGGTWTSGATGTATVGTGTGIVTGVAAGTVAISYAAPPFGCVAITTVTVNPLPAPIAGPSSVCMGSTITMSDPTPGGTWSTTSSIFTVGLTSALVTPISTGIAPVTYTLPTGCREITYITVNPLPSPITGVAVACEGAATTLSDATAGGTWTSGATGVATVSGAGLVSGISGGTAPITYTITASGCMAIATVTINPAPGPIAGNTNVCLSGTTTLSDAGSGTWTSSAPGTASIGLTSGIVTGNATGTATITYTLPSTGCFRTTSVVVNPLPGPITGVTSVCPGTSTTLSDGGGGTWTSSNPSIATINLFSGVVLGGTAGTTVITYTLSTGCIATTTVTVNPGPPAIAGPTSVCVGSTVTLSDAATGGTWASSNPAVATIGSITGLVTGITNGTVNITYTATTGCKATAFMTVNALPGPITGSTNVCVGSTTILSDAGTGTWQSGNTAVATVGTTSRIVTGIAAGTAPITFTLLSTGCMRTTTVTVDPAPAGITGIAPLCVGNTLTLSDATAGGTWASSNTTVATIGSSTGLVTAGIPGTTVISYRLTSTGCQSTGSLTVNSLPSTISGTTSVCEGSTTTLSNATLGGTWSSGATGIATIGSVSRIVTGISAGSAPITYTLPTGCMRITTVTVNPLPGAITGVATVCAGNTTTLSDAGGGTWASSNTAIATVGSSTGIVTGVTGGSATITYRLPVTGCAATQNITVNPSAAITGATSVCNGLSISLSNAIAGGTWESSNTAIATVGTSSGVVVGITSGTTTISYTLPSGCVATSTVTIVSAPGPITGSSTVCLSRTTTLSDAGGGTWSSSAPGIASVNPTTGVVTGIALGTATITYSLGTGCTVTMGMTVSPNPAPITGPSSVCAGASISLSDPTAGGVWSSNNTAVATVVSGTGVVTGVAPVNTNIIYTLPTGCFASKSVTVNPSPGTISGNLNVCLGLTSTLSDAPTGGTWSSSSTPIASVGLTSGIVTGNALGTATITYTSGGCRAFATVTVNALPTAIIGATRVCIGSTVTLSDAAVGGTWISSNANATAGLTTGDITGVSAGSLFITYTLPTGCRATRSMTVDPLPAPITGSSTVCEGSSTTLSDSPIGGTWISGTTGVATIGLTSGVVTGVLTGSTVITYTLPVTGCTMTTTISVDPVPSPITGVTSVCIGGSVSLTDATVGGTWSSSNIAVATIGTTGDVNGITAGTSTISYTLPTGCAAVASFVVNPLPAAITGAPNVCVGATATLSDASPGGTWVSGSTGVATIGSSTGIMTGVAVGTTVVTYTLPTGCEITRTITADPPPAAITGTLSVCAGSVTTLSDATPGGTWSSATTGVATIGSGTGIVSGGTAGTAIISYTIPTGCTATASVTVNPLPATITGATGVCEGASVTLSDASAGGTWSSSSTATATIIPATGVVTGVLAGTLTITYTLPTGCFRTRAMAVNPLPVAGTISGASTICIGTPQTYTSTQTGGTWSSSSTAVATADAATGVFTGVADGIVVISYSVSNICGTASANKSATVTAMPTAAPISGPASVCVTERIQLSDATPGGTWSVSNTNATVSSTGLVTGVTAGTDTVIYTVTNACGSATAKLLVTVNPYNFCHVGLPVDPASGSFRVYPNPSNGSFTVDVPATNTAATITIMDVTGRVIEKRLMTDANAQLVMFDLRNIVPGSYLVKVDAGSATFRQKIEVLK